MCQSRKTKIKSVIAESKKQSNLTYFHTQSTTFGHTE